MVWAVVLRGRSALGSMGVHEMQYYVWNSIDYRLLGVRGGSQLNLFCLTVVLLSTKLLDVGHLYIAAKRKVYKYIKIL